jgi:hydroxymethylbilane synthase
MIAGNSLTLEGLVATPDGREILRDRLAGVSDKAELIGSQLADGLMQRGAGALLNGLPNG